MKKISLALGISGGVYAFLAAAAVLCFLTMGPEGYAISYGSWSFSPVTYPQPELESLIFCLVIAASGMFGIAGALLARRYSAAGGVMMIIASLINISALPFILLLVGAIFAFEREKSYVPIATQNAYNIRSAKTCGIAGSILAIVCPVLILSRNVFAADDGGFSIGFNVLDQQLSLPKELMPLILAAAVLAGVGLLLNSTLLVSRRTKAAGVLMLVGAILNLGTYIATIFLLAGGIYALIAEKITAPTMDPKGENV